MTKITQENAVQELFKRIPELKTYHQFDEDELSSGPTIAYDFFGDFVLDRIKADDQSLIKKSFDLINEMQESEDPHVQNLPQVGVFEVLAGSKKGIEVAEKFLNEKGMEWFLKIKQHFNAR